MSLERIVKWLFKCDRCVRSVEVPDGLWEGRPHDWTGPERDDGYHLCDLCAAETKTPFSVRADTSGEHNA